MYFYSPPLFIYIFFLTLSACLLFYVHLVINNNIYNNLYSYKKNDCPDFWKSDLSGNCYFPTSFSFVDKNKIINSGDLKSLQINSKVAPYSEDGKSFLNNNILWSSSIQSTICAQREWALKNHIVWDGVSNYNKCI